MTVRDKRRMLAEIISGQPKRTVLELGCGSTKRVTDAIGIDFQDYDCVDIVGDAFEILQKMPSASIDEIYSFHFFEHIADLGGLLETIARVLKERGILEIVVPHFSNPYFYSDYTHRTFFGLYSMSYFASESLFRRKVPNYGRPLGYQLTNADLIFKSPKPFYFRYALKKSLGALFNLNSYTREFYEENLCYLFPCYEIRYTLQRVAVIENSVL